MEVKVKAKCTKTAVDGEEYEYGDIDEIKIFKGEEGEGSIHLIKDDRDFEDDETLRMDLIRNIEIKED